MTADPIEKRLRECAEDEGAAARAAKLLRALPEPSPLSESARRRVLRVLGAPSRNGRGVHFTALHWALLSVLLVTTAAASAKRKWFTVGFQHRAPLIETIEEPAVVSSPPTDAPSRRTHTVVDETPAAAIAPLSVKPRASTTAKPEPVRPRLLSDPQNDAIPRVLPKLVYDAQLYSVLLDVCVSAQGRVTRASVVRGQDAALDRQIVDAVERWTYLPGETGGQPAAMCFPLVYRIQVQRE
jgi:TonB family protein